MNKDRHIVPVFFFDAGPEGFAPPAPKEPVAPKKPLELPPAPNRLEFTAGPNPSEAQEAPELPKSKAEEMVDTIAEGLLTRGADLAVTIAKVAGRTDELSAGSADAPVEVEQVPQQTPKELVATDVRVPPRELGPGPTSDSAEASVGDDSGDKKLEQSHSEAPRALEDIVATPDMDSMKQLEGRIVNTPDGPMVLGKVQINIGSGEVAVLAHPFGVEGDDVSTTRLSLAQLRSGELSEMSDEEYMGSNVEQADISEAVQAIADDPEARAFVTADISELIEVLADKKGGRLDVVIDRAKSYQEAESSTVKTYGIDLEMATLQLKQDGLIRQTQKKPHQAAELQPQMDEIRARLNELKTMREEFVTEQNQIAEMGKQLGVAPDKADAAPLVALRDLVQTANGRKQLMDKLGELSEDNEQFKAMHETVQAITKREKLKSKAQMAGLSVGILMALMAGMVAFMASGRR